MHGPVVRPASDKHAATPILSPLVLTFSGVAANPFRVRRQPFYRFRFNVQPVVHRALQVLRLLKLVECSLDEFSGCLAVYR